MRHGIDTAPKDGRTILLGDGARYLVAKWSKEASAWVTQEGQPSELTATHWHDLNGDLEVRDEEPSARPRRVRRRVGFLVALACVATAAAGLYYREDLALFAALVPNKNGAALTASTSDHPSSAAAVLGGAGVEAATPLDQAEGQIHQAKLEGAESGNEASLSSLTSLSQPPKKEIRESVSQVSTPPIAAEAPKPEVSNPERDDSDRHRLNQELVDAQNQLADYMASSRRELEQERARSAALERELAAERQRKASSRSASDNPQDLKDPANASLDSDGRSIEEERTAALEISKIKALLDAVSGEGSHRQGFEEKADQPDVAKTAQQDGGSSNPPAAPNKVIEESRTTLPDQAKPAPAKPAVSPGNSASVPLPAADLAMLLARAKTYLNRGDIGAARSILGHASDLGSAQASFVLAETFDPRRLSAWKTYGTRGDAAKARELYAKAYAGGINEAAERMAALGL